MATYGDYTTVPAFRSSNPVDGPGEDALRHLAIISVGGMTCISCHRAIERGLRMHEFVQDVRVSLITHSAEVQFEAEGPAAPLAKRLIETIEDAGYDASLIELKLVPRATATGGAISEARRVALHIHGMRHSQCSQRILAAVQDLGVQVLEQFSLESPILVISYVPNAPELTIRRIIDAVTELDASFSVTVHKPTSVEQRARELLRRERRAISLRVLLSTCAAIPTLVIGIVYMDLVSHNNPGYKHLMEPMVAGVSRAEWAMFVPATLVYLFAADYFHKRTIKELWALWKPGSSVPILQRFYRFGSMNMLISLGTTIAYCSSIAQMIITTTDHSRDAIASSKQSYFDSVVFLTFFLLCGRLAEAYMKVKTGDAVSALGNLRPMEADLVRADADDASGPSETVRLSIDLIDVGDTVRIPHGSTPPCDGLLLDKAGEFNESSLTGESRRVKKTRSKMVFSGTINEGPAVTIRVTNPSGTSMLDSIIQVVREGQSKRAPMERIADRLTAYFVPIVVVIAVLTWIIWLSLGLSGILPIGYLDNQVGGWGFWSLQFAIAVFVIACPCGLGLAAPTAFFVGGGMAAQRGLLVKGGGEAFQEASNLDAVVFDKTGTLTQGQELRVTECHIFFDRGHGLPQTRIIAMLKRIEENSSHPLARAIVQYTGDFPSRKSYRDTGPIFIREIAGKGLAATLNPSMADDAVNEVNTIVGNERLMHDYNVQFLRDDVERLQMWKSAGHSIVLMAHRRDSETFHLAAMLALSDPVRPEAAEVIHALRQLDIDVWMLTGDNVQTASVVGNRVGIPPGRIIAGVLPHEKAERIKRLQHGGTTPRLSGRGFLSRFTRQQRGDRAIVAMVGDGINDAPALAAAHVGVAVASSADVAVQSAGFVLLQPDLRAILTLAALSRVVVRRVAWNFVWAAGYNIVAVPVAAGALYPIVTAKGAHVRLDPVWAALAMALSSISVLASSLLLRTRIPWVGYREVPQTAPSSEEAV